MIRRDEIEEFLRWARPYEPRKVYKYRSMSSPALGEIFTERKVYFADAYKFNDPFECRPPLTVGQDEQAIRAFLHCTIDEHRPEADAADRAKFLGEKRRLLSDPEFLRRTYDSFVTTTGIYSLAETNASLLMWAHYSDSHRGICLEFDPTRSGTLFWEVGKVRYQDDYPVVNILQFGPLEFMKAYLTKSNHWTHEQEWRILKIEEEGGPGYYPFPPDLLTGVILGALISPEHKLLVRHWLRSYPVPVTIFESRLDARSYKLNIVQTDQA